MIGDGTSPGDAQPKAKIFISYSRRDMAFVDRLEQALEARGFTPLFDPAQGRVPLTEALAILEKLEQEQKLPERQKSWPAMLWNKLTKLP
jgi:hypothetical protein